jgi:hypothetical protein
MSVSLARRIHAAASSASLMAGASLGEAVRSFGPSVAIGLLLTQGIRVARERRAQQGANGGPSGSRARSRAPKVDDESGRWWRG